MYPFAYSSADGVAWTLNIKMVLKCLLAPFAGDCCSRTFVNLLSCQRSRVCISAKKGIAYKIEHKERGKTHLDTHVNRKGYSEERI